MFLMISVVDVGKDLSHKAPVMGTFFGLSISISSPLSSECELSTCREMCTSTVLVQFEFSARISRRTVLESHSCRTSTVRHRCPIGNFRRRHLVMCDAMQDQQRGNNLESSSKQTTNTNETWTWLT
jgi:hypothetical protein